MRKTVVGILAASIAAGALVAAPLRAEDLPGEAAERLEKEAGKAGVPGTGSRGSETRGQGTEDEAVGSSGARQRQRDMGTRGIDPDAPGDTGTRGMDEDRPGGPGTGGGTGSSPTP